MKEKFIQFLKKNNAYARFLENVSRYSLELDKDICQKFDPLIWLTVSFQWNHTKQGFFYWNKLEKKWHKVLEEI